MSTNNWYLYQIRKDKSLSHITSMKASDYQEAIKISNTYFTTGEKFIATNRQHDAIELFNEYGVQYEVSNGDLIALYKMTTHTGDDRSEWVHYDEVVSRIYISQDLERPNT